jgi:hypothetical protein
VFTVIPFLSLFGLRSSALYLPSPVLLGSLVVIVLAVGTKVRGFKSCRGRWILRTIKIRSTPSFGGEAKPAGPCSNILRHVKDHCSTKEIGLLVGKTYGNSLQVSSALVLGVSCYSSSFFCFGTRCMLLPESFRG